MDIDMDKDKNKDKNKNQNINQKQTQTINKFNIYYGGILKTIPDGTFTIKDMYDDICSTRYKEICEKVQLIKNIDRKELKKERNEIKKTISYVTVGGIFKKRKKESVLNASGFAAIDIDNLENKQELENLKIKLKDDPYIKLLFISPSGEGLKAIIKIPNNIETFEDYVKSFYYYLSTEYKLNIENLDKKTFDISRACYLSYDPNIIKNENPKVFETLYNIKELEEKLKLNTKTKDNSRSGVEYREVLKLIITGRTKEYIYKHMESFEKWKDSTEQYHNITYEKAKKYIKENGRLNVLDRKKLIIELFDLCSETFSVRALISGNIQEMWIYNDGIYIPHAINYIEKFLKKTLKSYYDKNIALKVCEHLAASNYITPSDFFADEDIRYICVQNGVLDIFEKKLIPFTPKLKFFNKLPIIFDSSKTCETTMKHFQTILRHEHLSVMQELYGYFLYRDYKFENAFLFYGDGGNGKSKTIEQIKAFIGIDNTCNLSLGNIQKQPFLTCQLHKKLANLGAELGQADIKETDLFKDLTGHDLLTANRKFKEPISFTSYAKMVFAVNKLPHIDDNTDGFWRRWIPIGFNVCFLSQNRFDKLKTDGKLLPKYRVADTDMTTKLTTPDELSGVLNWALDGLNRLLKNDDFSFDKDYNEVRDEMRRRESSAIAFKQDCLERTNDPEVFVKDDEMFAVYIDYCQGLSSDEYPETAREFRKIMQQNGLPLQRKKINIGTYEYRWNFHKIKWRK